MTLQVLLSGCGGGDDTPASDGNEVTTTRACTEQNSYCISTANVTISQHANNKRAAASYLFDDGGPSSLAEAELFEKRGLRASFYIIPGQVNAGDWGKWRALSNAGHEIGNHSLTHSHLLDDPGLSDAALRREIEQAHDAIASGIGSPPIAFVFPGNHYNERSLAIVRERHIIARVPNFSEHMLYKQVNLGSDSLLSDVNHRLNVAIENGGWFVAAGHGIDGSGYSPIPSSTLEAHLDHALLKKNDLWIDTFSNVARYRYCRSKTAITYRKNGAEWSISTTRPMDDRGLCNTPLTLVVPLTTELDQALSLQQSSSGAIQEVPAGVRQIVTDIIPGDTIIIKAL